jgi:molecular chaperone GrpE
VSREDFARLCADFDNYRKQSERVNASAARMGEKRLALDLLPVLDDLDCAAQALPEDSKEGEGLLIVRKRLASVLRAHGVEEIAGSKGMKFDHCVHEAVKADAGAPDGVISEELRKGYSFRGEVLRHAMVGVGSGAKRDEGKKGGECTE